MEFVSVHKKGELLGVLNLDDVSVKFLQDLLYQRYEFKKISKNVFENGKKFLHLSNETRNNLV
jgi:hypothetical protein